MKKIIATIILLIALVGISSAAEPKGKTYDLTLYERYQLIPLLPDSGNYTFLNLVGTLEKELSPSLKEITDWNIRETASGNIRWDVAESKKIFIPEVLRKKIDETLTALSKSDRLDRKRHMTLYGKIVRVPLKKGGDK